MSRAMTVLVTVLCLTGLLSCAAPPTLPAATAAGPSPINPGDRIGDILVTTATADEVQFAWDSSCVQVGTEQAYRCKGVVGRKYNISAGVYADQGKTIDEVWAEHTQELVIGDRPINLAAFGTVETSHPHIGQMRAWNVALAPSAPGEITIRSKGNVGGKSWDELTTYEFTAQ